MEEWKKYKMSDFIDFNPTVSLKKGTVARKITMDKLIPHSRDIYDWEYEPYSGGTKFQNGDTIMARITPCLENGKHAFISLLNDGETAYGSDRPDRMSGSGPAGDRCCRPRPRESPCSAPRSPSAAAAWSAPSLPPGRRPPKRKAPPAPRPNAAAGYGSPDTCTSAPAPAR